MAVLGWYAVGNTPRRRGKRKKKSRCWPLRRRPVTEVTIQQDRLDYNEIKGNSNMKFRKKISFFSIADSGVSLLLNAGYSKSNSVTPR